MSIESLRRDLLLAIRTLRRRGGYTAVVALTLGLGIGANTAVFSVVDAVLLRPLPYAAPDRLATLWAELPEQGRLDAHLSGPELAAIWDSARSFESVGAGWARPSVLRGDGPAEEVRRTRHRPGPLRPAVRSRPPRSLDLRERGAAAGGHRTRCLLGAGAARLARRAGRGPAGAVADAGLLLGSAMVTDSQASAPLFHDLRLAFRSLLRRPGFLGHRRGHGGPGDRSFAVGQRTREIAVRVALGAAPSSIRGLVLRRGVRLAAASLAVGAMVAALCARAAGSLLFGVEPFDPLTYAASAAILLAVALLACWVPAERAARIAPVVALRED